MGLGSLKGWGPKSVTMLKQVAIENTQQFMACETFELYVLLKKNIPWQDIKKSRRIEILLRLDDMGVAPKWAASLDGQKSLGSHFKNGFVVLLKS